MNCKNLILTNIWDYVDKRNLAINVLKNYKAMKKIVEITPQNIKDEYDNMTSISSAKYDDMPKYSTEPDKKDYKIINQINKIDVLEYRYQKAINFLNWIDPIIDSLEIDEKAILNYFYLSHIKFAASKIAKELGYSEPHIYKIKDELLEKFATYLVA